MSPLTPRVAKNAEVIWNYMRLGTAIQPAQALLVCGSTDLIVPYYAASLFHSGFAKLIVTSGGVSHTTDLLNTGWLETEAEIFRDALLSLGVPSAAIIMESTAKNSAENFRFAAKLLKQQNVALDDTLVVHKPYMERRAHATGKICWAGHDIRVTSPPATFQYYCQHVMDPVRLINVMVGDLQRLDVYGERGLNEKHVIPDEVALAQRELISAGFNKHLVT